MTTNGAEAGNDFDTPRRLTTRDRAELGFAFAVTLIRGTAILGFSGALLLFSFSFDTHYLTWCAAAAGTYILGTWIMTSMLKHSNARIAARHEAASRS